MLAGCYGDFNGDGRRDYALLLQGAGAEVIPPLWPGPYCRNKPPNGQYKAFESSVRVVGDVIQVGWYGYYWLPKTMRFEAVLIQD